jgi:hypothetical protein
MTIKRSSSILIFSAFLVSSTFAARNGETDGSDASEREASGNSTATASNSTAPLGFQPRGMGFIYSMTTEFLVTILPGPQFLPEFVGDVLVSNTASKFSIGGGDNERVCACGLPCSGFSPFP